MPVDQERAERIRNAANGAAGNDNAAPVPPRWRRCRDDIDEIQARAVEPLVTLALGEHEIATLRAGATALLIGATGGGKTSLALTLLLEHAARRGPALAVSLELPADELTARAIGIRRDASWLGVLTGQLSTGEMLGALPERLYRIRREDASIDAIDAAIEDLKRTYPGEPVLAAIDYVQLVGADSDDDIRPRVGRNMRDIDRVVRQRGAVCIALSQGSRASSRGLTSGERIGADTTDAGAEASDLERWSSLTIAIGARSDPDEDGAVQTQISIGKMRMGTGDRVLPARYVGRSGAWEIVGDARLASEVRTERETQRETQRITTLGLAIRTVLESAGEPLSRRDLRERVGGRGEHVRAAVATLLADPESGVVEVGARHRGHYRVWTRPRATAAGVEIHGGGE